MQDMKATLCVLDVSSRRKAECMATVDYTTVVAIIGDEDPFRDFKHNVLTAAELSKRRQLS